MKQRFKLKNLNIAATWMEVNGHFSLCGSMVNQIIRIDTKRRFLSINSFPHFIGLTINTNPMRTKPCWKLRLQKSENTWYYYLPDTSDEVLNFLQNSNIREGIHLFHGTYIDSVLDKLFLPKDRGTLYFRFTIKKDKYVKPVARSTTK